MVQYVITPWRNQDELLLVRQQLYPDTGKPLNNKDRRHAVAKVSVWMQRGNCPHLVESSAIITAAILNDVPGNSTYCVRAAYSAAFCRFVTGLLDSHQDARRKLSMYSIAKNLGLPATYVELRHQATHEELPSLSKLRIASQKALRWIWEYYWVKLSPKESSQSQAQQSNPETKRRKEDKYTTFAKWIVNEKDPIQQGKLEKRLRQWGSPKLLDALEAYGHETTDSGLLLRNLKIQELVMNIILGSEDPVLPEDPEKPERSEGALGDIMKELEEMEEELGDDDEDEEDEDDNDNDEGNKDEDEEMVDEKPDEKENIKGWTLWEGPWIPKPIGVV